MATVGYFLGTDSKTLTRLVVNGIETLPLSNGYDNHGKLVGHVTSRDGVSLVIGPLHKALPVHGGSAKDILYNLQLQHIPVALVVDTSDLDKGREILGEMADGVRFTTEERLYETVTEVLAG